MSEPNRFKRNRLVRSRHTKCTSDWLLANYLYSSTSNIKHMLTWIPVWNTTGKDRIRTPRTLCIVLVCHRDRCPIQRSCRPPCRTRPAQNNTIIYLIVTIASNTRDHCTYVEKTCCTKFHKSRFEMFQNKCQSISTCFCWYAAATIRLHETEPNIVHYSHYTRGSYRSSTL